jgi:hypothetical protein
VRERQSVRNKDVRLGSAVLGGLAAHCASGRAAGTASTAIVASAAAMAVLINMAGAGAITFGIFWCVGYS